MKHTYNTGKVQIGLRYEQPKNYPVSRDMEALQRGLLQAKLERRAASAAYMVGIVFLFVLGVVWVIR